MADSAVEQAIVKNEQYSVRQFSPGAWGGMVGDAFGFLWPARADLLPRYGTIECDIALRTLHYTQHNSLWGGAVNIWIQKVLGTPYEISGGRNKVFQWQDLFFESDFGEGYDYMMSKALVDYLTLNRGMFLEKVSYGDPDTPIQEGAKILGLNHLDALRIQFTGNREWPYLYFSEWGGGLHRMHYTRVVHLSQQPSPNTLLYGIGKSPLYDAVSIVNAQILLGKHQNELLNDLPPPGIVIFNNVRPDQVQDAIKQFEYERIRDGQNMYRAPLSLSSLNPEQPASVTFVPLSTVPEGFNYHEFMEVHVNGLALCLQLDPQDIWPLAATKIGSGMQSNILESKTSSKGSGYMLTRLERVWNFGVLSKDLEWKYKAPNAQEDIQNATTAKTWIDTLNTATFLSPDEKRGIAATQVPAFADELLDEAGNIRLFDADPKEQGQVLADDAALNNAPALPAPTAPVGTAPPDKTTSNDNTQLAPATPAAKGYEWKTNGVVWWTEKVTHKGIDDTDSAFVDEIQAIMQDGISRSITKAGCAARIRGAINRYGKLAYMDGLKDGCVDTTELDEDDTRIISDIAVHDTQYVTDLVNQIYSADGMTGTPESRAPLWKSTTDEFYYAGVQSADKNGMYEFTGDDGKENCATCASLKGQKHRMSWWVSKELRPGVDHDNFDCGTWPDHCMHTLERVGGC